MATDANGTPSTLGIPKYNTAADPPSGKGLNAIVDAIDTLLAARVTKATLTTTGDIFYASSASTPARLAIGSAGQVLTVAGGIPSWAAGSNAVSSVFTRTGAVVAATNDYTDAQVQNSPTNKLTTAGDLLYASSANTLARLGIGGTSQVLTVSGGIPSWGMRIQAGVVTGVSTSVDVTFATAFSTTPFVVASIDGASGSGGDGSVPRISARSTTGFTLVEGAGGTRDYCWIAVGT